MRPVSGVVLTGVLTLAAWTISAQTTYDPHADPNTGVQRLATVPSTRGQCRQCHATHEDSPNAPVFPIELFTDNVNRIAFWFGGDIKVSRSETLGGARFVVRWPAQRQPGF